MATTGTFPTLDSSEILSFLKELGIDFTDEDLRNPQAQNVRTVYENFVEWITGTTADTLQQPVLAALEHLGYPELYEEAIPELQFQKILYVLQFKYYIY